MPFHLGRVIRKGK